MRRFFKYLFILSLAAVFSCDKVDFSADINCDECGKTDPKDAELHITLDAAKGNNTTLVQVYEGLPEDQIISSTHYVSGTDLSVTVNLNVSYTVTAKYQMDNGSCYIAVNSTTPRVKYVPSQCQDPCYLVYDNKLDLTLKYMK